MARLRVLKSRLWAFIVVCSVILSFAEYCFCFLEVPSCLEVGFGVIERFAADLAAAHIAGIGLGVASHLSPYEEGDLLQLGFPIGRPMQRTISLSRDITLAGTVCGAGTTGMA